MGLYFEGKEPNLYYLYLRSVSIEENYIQIYIKCCASLPELETPLEFLTLLNERLKEAERLNLAPIGGNPDFSSGRKESGNMDLKLCKRLAPEKFSVFSRSLQN